MGEGRNGHTLKFVTQMKHSCYGMNMFIRYDNKQDPPFNNINIGPAPVEQVTFFIMGP